jgi:hypothetical protein
MVAANVPLLLHFWRPLWPTSAVFLRRTSPASPLHARQI